MTTATNLKSVPLYKRYMTFTGAVVGLLVLVLALFAFLQPSILVDTLVTGGMWALMAGGLALVFGVMNIPNFAHGEFFMIGSLVAFTVFTPIQDIVLSDPAHTGTLKMFGPIPGMVLATIVGFVVRLHRCGGATAAAATTTGALSLIRVLLQWKRGGAWQRHYERRRRRRRRLRAPADIATGPVARRRASEVVLRRASAALRLSDLAAAAASRRSRARRISC